MTLVVITALGVGVGLVGIVAGVRGQRPSLLQALTNLHVDEGSTRRLQPPMLHSNGGRLDHRAATFIASSVRERRFFDRELRTRLALVDSSLEALCARCVVGSAIGFLLPGLTWIAVAVAGVSVPVLIPFGAGILFGVVGALLPVIELDAESKRARRHAERVICSFLDLVVLGLGGGMGIESALFTAAQLGENAVSRRLVAELSLCRDAGEPPWEALERLGDALGIDELCELAATARLAGTEGARVRTTLAARAASIRRHELANEEAEANALTEKLFVPGAFLLVGFLLFIGYPAFTRIASGF
jgi:tight adherence protein C